MSEKVVSSLSSVTSLKLNDLVYIVDSQPDGTFISKQMEVQEFLGKPPVGIDTYTSSGTPLNSADVFGVGKVGVMRFDSNYLYIQVSDTEVKRVQLFTF